MKFNVLSILILFLGMCHVLSSCKKTEELIDFTEEDEIALGEKLAEAIAADEGFSILPTEGNSIPYGYVNSRILEITSASQISKGDEFIWRIYLLDDPERQAFALPGGHIYVTTGMIFFLDNEDQFSGLLAHLIAHIDQSHITQALFFKYGVNRLKNLSTSGGVTELKSIIDDLDLSDSFLPFSRGNELEADTLAISMLSETEQSCESVKLFFEKTLNVQANNQAALIAAHLLQESRLEDISTFASSVGCDVTVDDQSGSRFRSFRNALP
ncbi:MAG: M48 family metallopeptidase [Ekhidna sp.]